MTIILDIINKQRSLRRRIENSVSNFLKQGDSDMTVEAARRRVEILNDHYKDFTDNLDRLVELRTDEKEGLLSYFVEDECEQCESKYANALGWFDGWIKAKEASPTFSTSSTSVSGTEPAPVSAETDDTKAKTELPKIALPTFEGNLVSQAKDTVTGLPVVDDAFGTTWTRAREESENPRLAVQEHCESLLSLLAVQHQSYEEYRDFYNRFRTGIDGLKALGRNGFLLFEDLVLHIGILCLDCRARQLWEFRCSKSTACSSLTDFFYFLSTLVFSTKPQDNVKETPRVSLPPGKASVATLCPACKKPHPLNVCPNFLARSVSARKTLIEIGRCCSNCLSSTHLVERCPSSKRCEECQGLHHTLIHPAEPRSTELGHCHRPSSPRSSSSEQEIDPELEMLSKTACVRDGSFQYS